MFLDYRLHCLEQFSVAIEARPVAKAAMAEQLVTLCFVVQDGRVLLIRKKRGIGAGKINAPGGKVDPGESPLAAAVRETEEEIGVTPLQPQLRGDLRFRFRDGLRLRCTIYLATGCVGEPCETAEAVPQWFALDAIPYAEMWEDDQHWVPLLLAGKRFRGTVDVDGEHTVGQQIEVLPAGQALEFDPPPE